MKAVEVWVWMKGETMIRGGEGVDVDEGTDKKV